MIIYLEDDKYEFKDFLPVDDLFEIGFPHWQLIQKMQDGIELNPEEGIELYKYFLLFLKRIQLEDTDVGQLDLTTVLRIIKTDKMQQCIARSFGQNALGIPESTEKKV